mmetsp:Transcript_33436/g.94666  ORF Transcript_33436/g.94666 Transcript_33436/m.94666 type:complete len:172 (-) Transcript_33436:113-628(-)
MTGNSPLLPHAPDSGRIALLAPLGVAAALSTPRVWRNYHRLLKPTIFVTVITQVVSFLLVLPFQLLLLLLWLLTLGQLPGIYNASHKLGEMHAEVVFMSPLVVMLVFRTVYRSSISKCFFDTFEVVNPVEARRVKELRVLRKENGQSHKPKPTTIIEHVYSGVEWIGKNKV